MALNPEAPIFVPWAYRAVEDFSDEWWDLVQCCPSFRDYWLRECFDDEYILFDDAFNEGKGKGKGKGKEGDWDLVAMGRLKWRKPKAEMPSYSQKPPRIVSIKLKPRPIQQPR